MDNGHDPNKTLKTSHIEFTGDTKVVVGEKLKKVLTYLAIAAAITVLALLIPFISIVLVLSMPVTLGLSVYATYLWYRSVVAAENQAPDWSKVKLPTPEDLDKQTEAAKAKESADDRVTYS